MKKNEQLRIAWDFVENTGRSIFLTGKAGTGKTTFLKAVVEHSRKRSVVVAPTGVAAINAGGVTIHSFFQLPLSPFVPDAHIKQRFDFSREKRRIIASLDLLIIDEISMVRSDLLDAIDHVLRRYRNHYQPFGGVQLLMIGDLQQLTPVTTPEDERMLAPYYDTPYFFGSKALAQTPYVTIQLEQVYRQQDEAFIQLLNNIRLGQATSADLSTLNARYQPTFIPSDKEPYIRLTTHNRLADSYNEDALRRLSGKSFTYQAMIDGTFPDYSYPTALSLTLKVGTQVMFVKNDPSGNHLYYNGRIGRVTYVDDTKILVLCPGDTDAITVEPLTWENARYTLNEETREIETEVQGTFKQYPLRLAWAITIHKSQGLTFDHAIIDASLSFAPGQVYVALSRCRTLEGMVLASPLSERAIINDQRVDDYIAHQEENAQQSIGQLPQLKEEYFRYLLVELFNFTEMMRLQERMERTFIEYFSHSHPQLLQLQRQTTDELKTKVVTVAEKWTATIQRADTATLHSEAFLQRVRRSADYFAPLISDLMEKPLRLTGQVTTKNKQARYRLDNDLADLRQTATSKHMLLRRIAIEGFSITTYLHEKQMTLLDAMGDGKGKAKAAKKAKQKEPKEPKEKTQDITLRLYRQGLQPAQIARERDLTLTTIINHLAQHVETGEISLDVLISQEHQRAIRRFIRMVGDGGTITAIKALCPSEISYDEIRLMMKYDKQ